MTDGRRRGLLTRAFVALFAAARVLQGRRASVLPVASPFARPARGGCAGVGIAIGAFALGRSLLRPVVGWASDRYGRRPLLRRWAHLVARARFHLVGRRRSRCSWSRGRCSGSARRSSSWRRRRGERPRTARPARRGDQPRLARAVHRAGLGPPSARRSSTRRLRRGVGRGGRTATVSIGPVAGGAGDGPGRARGRDRRDEAAGRLFHPAGLFPGAAVLPGHGGWLPTSRSCRSTPNRSVSAAPAVPLAVYAALVVVLRIVFAKLPDQIGAARLSRLALGEPSA